MVLSPQEIMESLSSSLMHIAVQGGELTLSPEKTGCLVSGIWIESSSGWFEITGIEVELGDEITYALSVETCSFPPVPEKSRLMRPPRNNIKNFPSFCRLDLVISHESQSPEVKVEIYTFDDPVGLIRSIRLVSTSGSFEFIASDKYPENVEIFQTIQSRDQSI